MNGEHPLELLPVIAEGRLVQPAVRDHVAECARCTAALASLSSLDVDYVWKGVAAAIDAPAPGLLERFLRLIGIDPALARFTAVAPSLHVSWLLGSVAVVAVAVLVSIAAPMRVAPLLVVAPLIGAGAIAFAYGPVADPAYEIVAATPASAVLAVLLRLSVVLAVNAAVVGLAVAVELTSGRAHPLAGHAFAWLLPMASVSLLAAVVGTRTQPVIGAATGMGAWLGVVMVAMSATRGIPALWTPAWQYGHACVAAVLLGVLLLIVYRGAPLPERNLT